MSSRRFRRWNSPTLAPRLAGHSGLPLPLPLLLSLPFSWSLSLVLSAWLMLGPPAAYWSLAQEVPVAADESVPAAAPLERELVVAERWTIEHPTHHVQGLCVSDEAFWISSVERAARRGWIFRVDRRTLAVSGQRELTFAAQYHPGGMQRVGDTVWVAVAEYRPRSTSRVVRLDAVTLETRGELAVDDHLGAVAADGHDRLWAVNWDARQFYQLSGDGRVLAVRDSPTGVAYQDIEWHEGLLLGVGWLKEGGGRAVVDTIDPVRWQLLERDVLVGEVASGGRNFGREGFALWRQSYFVLPEDGPRSTVYRFALP